jgi:hypothetical protein
MKCFIGLVLCLFSFTAHAHNPCVPYTKEEFKANVLDKTTHIFEGEIVLFDNQYTHIRTQKKYIIRIDALLSNYPEHYAQGDIIRVYVKEDIGNNTYKLVNSLIDRCVPSVELLKKK